MTNADKIRSMTNEQLIPVVFRYVCQNMIPHGKPCQHAECDDCIRNWLKQEVNENDKVD